MNEIGASPAPIDAGGPPSSVYDVELHHLRYFAAVASVLSFRRAAEQLRVAQPAVTRAIQQLEAELGVMLLHRSRVQVSLTPAGALVLDRAQAVLESIARLGDGISAAAGAGLRIGHVLPEYFRAGPLARRLRQFKARHPGVSIEVRAMLTPRMLRELASGQLDAGFAWLPVEGIPRALRVDVVMLDEPVIALPPAHRLLGADTVRLGDLRGETFLLFPRAAMPERYDEIVGMLRRAGLDPAIETAKPSLRAVLHAVGERRGISVVPRIAATRHRRAGFTLHEIDGVSARWSLGLLAPRRGGGEALSTFLDAMRSE